MIELQLQEKFLIPFFIDNVNGLGYKEVKATTITSNLIIEEDLKQLLNYFYFLENSRNNILV